MYYAAVMLCVISKSLSLISAALKSRTEIFLAVALSSLID